MNSIIKGRHEKVVEEIKSLSPDIITFQEIETQHFHHSLLPDMASLGYNSVQHLRYFKLL